MQTGHLQNICPEAKKDTIEGRRRAGNRPKAGNSPHQSLKRRTK